MNTYNGQETKIMHLNNSFEYALIPIKHASKALVEVCNSESIIKPYYEPRYDKNKTPEYYWDKMPHNAILITQQIFGGYEQEYIQKVYKGSWHINDELLDEMPYILDILKNIYGENIK